MNLRNGPKVSDESLLVELLFNIQHWRLLGADPVSSVLVDLLRDAESDLGGVGLRVLLDVVAHMVGMHTLHHRLYVVALSSVRNFLAVHVHAGDVDYLVLVLDGEPG